MGFTISDTASDMSYLVFRNHCLCMTGVGGEQHMKIDKRRLLACVVSMTTENKKGINQKCSKLINIFPWKIQATAGKEEKLRK